MQTIADLHVHSKYSRATSPKMDVDGIFNWSKIKGINLVATGDYTHPEYFKELKQKLELDSNGFYRVKNVPNDSSLMPHASPHFVPTAEISCIYKKNDKCRRLHIVLITPTLEDVEKINTHLNKIGNVKSDGRPILGLDAKELAKIVFSYSPNSLVIPAHAWTPWFAIFGSKSGFDTMEECFEELTPKIYAIETGLSSDPPMNWRLSALDNLTLISNSDAHSPANMGREVNVLELQELTYQNFLKAIRREEVNKLESPDKTTPPHPSKGTTPVISPLPRASLAESRRGRIKEGVGEGKHGLKNYLKYTIEFFPQEGKYHYDGHIKCKVCLSPEESKKNKGLCPKCKKPLTLGVDYRVSELADRPVDSPKPKKQADYKRLVPLQEIIAECFSQGKNTKKVQTEYQSMISKGKNEFNILLNLSETELNNITTPKITEAIKRVRAENLIIHPGYDGEYGVVKIFNQEELDKDKQKELF